jgi:hypothetical protein
MEEKTKGVVDTQPGCGVQNAQLWPRSRAPCNSRPCVEDQEASKAKFIFGNTDKPPA